MKAIFLRHDVGRKLDQVRMSGMVVMRQRLDRRRTPWMQVHPDLTCISRNHVTAKANELWRHGHLIIGEPSRFESELLAQRLETRQEGRIARLDRIGARPLVVALRIDGDDECRTIAQRAVSRAPHRPRTHS